MGIMVYTLLWVMQDLYHHRINVVNQERNCNGDYIGIGASEVSGTPVLVGSLP